MISRGGQISIPAAVRRRWGTRALTVEDRGDHIEIRPAPEDPVAAARGVLKGKGSDVTAEELRRLAREDERRAEQSAWERS